MSYSKQTWVDNSTPLSAQRLNNIETGLASAAQYLGSGTAFPAAGIGPGDWFLRTDVGAAPGTMYQYNGVTWIQYQVVSDSGWVNFTPNGPITVGSTGCKYRNFNGVVQIHLDSSYNGPYSGSFSFFTLPVGSRPGTYVYSMATPYGATSNVAVPVVVSPGGVVSMDSTGSYNYAGVIIDFTFLAA